MKKSFGLLYLFISFTASAQKIALPKNFSTSNSYLQRLMPALAQKVTPVLDENGLLYII